MALIPLRLRVRSEKSARRSFSVTPPAAMRLLAQARGDAIALGEQDARELGLVGDVAVESRLARNALRFAFGGDGTVVPALRQTPETQAIFAEAQDRLPLIDPLQIANQAKA